MALGLYYCYTAQLVRYRAMPSAGSPNANKIYFTNICHFFLLFSATRKQPECVGDGRTANKTTSDIKELSIVCLLPKTQKISQTKIIRFGFMLSQNMLFFKDNPIILNIYPSSHRAIFILTVLAGIMEGRI